MPRSAADAANRSADLNTLLRFFDLAAILAAGLSGALDARSKKMDLVGVYFVALATALGGGTARDLLLDRRPVFWIARYEYLLSVLIAALVAILFAGRGMLPNRRVNRAINFFDAIGLGLFGMVGCTYALNFDCAPPVAVLIGVVNGIFGGILRDISCGEIPSVFRKNTQLYATCAFLGCVGYIAMTHLGVPYGVAFPTGMLMTFTARMLAIRYNVGLPV